MPRTGIPTDVEALRSPPSSLHFRPGYFGDPLPVGGQTRGDPPDLIAALGRVAAAADRKKVVFHHFVHVGRVLLLGLE